jgi:hypothetical protein
MSDHHPSVPEARRTEHTLLGTDDAMTWAEEFCRVFKGFTITSTDVDGLFIGPGTMVGWFANAMQTAINMLPEMADADDEEEILPLEKEREKFIEGFEEGRSE